MKPLLSSSELKNSTIKTLIWDQLKELTRSEEGYLYYKYPITGVSDSYIPCFSIIDYKRGIVLIDLLDFTISSLDDVSESSWVINGKQTDNPLLKLDDYKIGLENITRNYRQIRNKITINTYILLPEISADEFRKKFGKEPDDSILFGNVDSLEYSSLYGTDETLTEDEKQVFISVTQGAGPLIGKINIPSTEKAPTIGAAIKLLEKKMARLDEKQHEAAIQIPDGPQRIRGMAGTGKTVILAMKAAYLHGRFPEAKILYTFHTQSLYNQVRNLVTRFYREQNSNDPDFSKLLILHSWGGKYKEGVYFRTCIRNSLVFKGYRDVPGNVEEPLDYVCSEILNEKIQEEFDFVLMDESQDFPPSFFQLIYKITKQPKRIIFAYDELQSLTNINMQDVKELFGCDESGKALVDFSAGYYADEIEMDIILEKSYRNPYELLMVAHGLGMGLYNEDGIMQIIDDEKIWNSIGYEIASGKLVPNTRVEIKRPPENTISLVRECYDGPQKPFLYMKFDNMGQEIEWLAENIRKDVFEENVEPHNIVVISLNKGSYKNEFPLLQNHLYNKGVSSIIPGYEGTERDKFGEYGYVTLSTVFKAKGNEAFLIYVMSLEYIYDYVEFVQARNSVFTALTRTKGWCRISGCGSRMDRAIKEIDMIFSNLPMFKFIFPDPDKIARKLSQEEYARRVAETRKVKKSVESLLAIDAEAMKTIPKDQLDELIRRLKTNVD
jgi:Superfamily I DNA and RNA helicases